MIQEEWRKIKPLIKRSIKEDLGKKDITTDFWVNFRERIKGVLLSKEEGVIAGLEIVKMVFDEIADLLGQMKIKFKSRLKDTQKVQRNQVVADIEGRARVILTGERTALNFLQKLSGIASLTSKYVNKVESVFLKTEKRGTKIPKIYDTRKTTPGLRILEKYAVKCGGGYNHRFGLWDMVLIKDNHLRIAQTKKEKNLAEMIAELKTKLPPKIKIEIEVGDLNCLKEVLKTDIDLVMLDNMDLETLKEAMEIIENSLNKPQVEVSGQINLENVAKIARLGPDRISIGELTHSPNVLDISLEVL